MVTICNPGLLILIPENVGCGCTPYFRVIIPLTGQGKLPLFCSKFSNNSFSSSSKTKVFVVFLLSFFISSSFSFSFFFAISNSFVLSSASSFAFFSAISLSFLSASSFANFLAFASANFLAFSKAFAFASALAFAIALFLSLALAISYKINLSIRAVICFSSFILVCKSCLYFFSSPFILVTKVSCAFLSVSISDFCDFSSEINSSFFFSFGLRHY
ncbi:hypothetical protein PG913_00140 [Tenacibaculum pacificus]|uniref:hypothetical protein n=1 Tax=Tenacibaculum pacificus TaxID=3018314 RepID=UPI0022F39699|nr:hypothetical protein [Tenacibaculum pacificus]WBX73713.1 hypothetical protein PG913_00140 [Tenacibaculum pacificus]